jgi:hypothetical protein
MYRERYLSGCLRAPKTLDLNRGRPIAMLAWNWRCYFSLVPKVSEALSGTPALGKLRSPRCVAMHRSAPKLPRSLGSRSYTAILLHLACIVRCRGNGVSGSRRRSQSASLTLGTRGNEREREGTRGNERERCRGSGGGFRGCGNGRWKMENRTSHTNEERCRSRAGGIATGTSRARLCCSEFLPARLSRSGRG